MKYGYASGLFCWIALAIAVRAWGQEAAPENAPAPQPAQEAGPAPLAAVPITGSQLPHDEITCARCHTEPALWDTNSQRLFVSPDDLQHDVHWQHGVACSDCHGGDPASMDFAAVHATLIPLKQLKRRCADCHHDQWLSLVKGVHAKVGDKDERGRGTPLDCRECHGTKPHNILPAHDRQSPVFVINQVGTCGRCHPKYQESYDATVHGRGLYESGLMVTAVCSNCHGGARHLLRRRSTFQAPRFQRGGHLLDVPQVDRAAAGPQRAWPGQRPRLCYRAAGGRWRDPPRTHLHRLSPGTPLNVPRVG